MPGSATHSACRTPGSSTRGTTSSSVSGSSCSSLMARGRRPYSRTGGESGSSAGFASNPNSNPNSVEVSHPPSRTANFIPRHPSSRPLRSPPSPRPHSIARAARAPIAPTPPPARRARALYARLPRRVLAPSRAPPARRSRRRLLQTAELALSTLASLVASTLHRARRHFCSPRADRANASFRPPSSRPLRSPPSPRPHSIALAATFVSLAPIASMLADDSASRLPIARVFCPCRPRRASLSIARAATFVSRGPRVDRAHNRQARVILPRRVLAPLRATPPL